MEIRKLEKIADFCILQSSEVGNLGLFSGKIGIIIFMFHYSIYSKKKIYADFAEILIDELFKDIHKKIPLDFDKGLAGIGWGIEYIIKNNFVKGDSYEILGNIDKQLMIWNIKRYENESLECGLEGLFHYILYHLPINKTMKIPFDSEYIKDIEIVATKKAQYCENFDLQNLAQYYVEWIKGGNLNYNPNILIKRVFSIISDLSEYKEKSEFKELYNSYSWMGIRLLDILNLK